MYSVAAIPIGMGTAIAWAERQLFDGRIFFTFLISGILILVWLNLTNDVFDADTGIDTNNDESLVTLTGNAQLVLNIANACLGFGLCGVGAIALWQLDATVFLLVVACCALGYAYQGPPFRWGYLGLGEPICFLTFGPMAVSAAYYSQAQAWSATSWAASVLVGISTTSILFCSHFHQVEDDLAAGKRSPVVRLGTARAARVVRWAVVTFFAFLIVFVAMRLLPLWALVVLVAVPPARNLCRLLDRYHDQPDRVRSAKFGAVSFHLCSQLLLMLGFVLALK
jgi:1,4-dihydroxy-2-naphthoate octaprenyltransferase